MSRSDATLTDAPVGINQKAAKKVMGSEAACELTSVGGIKLSTFTADNGILENHPASKDGRNTDV